MAHERVVTLNCRVFPGYNTNGVTFYILISNLSFLCLHINRPLFSLKLNFSEKHMHVADFCIWLRRQSSKCLTWSVTGIPRYFQELQTMKIFRSIIWNAFYATVNHVVYLLFAVSGSLTSHVPVHGLAIPSLLVLVSKNNNQNLCN